MTRIEEALQPAGVRAASAIRDASTTLGIKLQVLLEQTSIVLRGAFDPQLANLFVALLTPSSLIALVFGLWRIGVDLEWTEAFPIEAGFFSHWQVWIALAIALKFAASSLQIRARSKASEEN